jgi:hypothetical protein
LLLARGQVCCSYLALVFFAQICCSDSLFRFVAHIHCSDLLLRFVAEILRFVGQICCSHAWPVQLCPCPQVILCCAASRAWIEI